MKLIYSHLLQLLPDLKNVSAKEVANRLTYLGHFNDSFTSIENEEIIGLEVRQNRGEALSYYGLGLDLSVAYNTPLQLPPTKELQITNNEPPITINSPDVYRIQALSISNLKNSPSPPWLSKFLRLHEINSINTLVDLTNYIMLLYGIPCHAFDAKKAPSLIWENNNKFKQFTTLDGTLLKLQPQNLIIHNNSEVLSLSFIGGQNSGIELSTTDTIIEMAVYNRSRVKKDSRGLKTTTEASVRLDKELDTELIPKAFNHLANLILELCGGQISSTLLDYYPHKPQILKITFDAAKPSRVAGINIPTDFSLNILKKLNCTFSPLPKGDKEGFNITPPSIRKDITIEEDLIEEVIRFYGYDKIPVDQPILNKQLSDITPKILYLIKSLKNQLTDFGYDEVRSWPLVQEPLDSKSVIATQNSINSEYPYLRQSMIQSLKAQLDSYQRYKLPNPQFFEIGKIFYKENGSYIEKYSLGIYHHSQDQLTSDLKKLNLPTTANQNFFEIILDNLLVETPRRDVSTLKTQAPQSTTELTSQIITLDANVNYDQKQEPLNLINSYSQKIDSSILWSIDITDVYHDEKTNKYRYTFRVSYYNCTDKAAKSTHLKTFGLGELKEKPIIQTTSKNTPTKPIYYADMYLTTSEAKIIDLKKIENLQYLVLDQTIFFPEGGGQPSDIGTISNTPISHAIFKNNQVLHLVSKASLKIGDTVSLSIDWNYRYKYMKIHSAGHLLHEISTTLFPNLKPIKGSHGDDAYLMYSGSIDHTKKIEIENLVNQKIQEDLQIICKYASYDELVRECREVPVNLPKNKPLRMLKIGNYPAMPDGGIQVKSTKEIGKIKVTSIENSDSQCTIHYNVI